MTTMTTGAPDMAHDVMDRGTTTDTMTEAIHPGVLDPTTTTIEMAATARVSDTATTMTGVVKSAREPAAVRRITT